MFSNDSKKQREYNIKITCEIIDIKFIVWYKLDFCFYQLLQHEQVHTSFKNEINFKQLCNGMYKKSKFKIFNNHFALI